MRLLLIHTGGTLMMRGGHPTPLVPDVYQSDLLTELPVLRRVADIETQIFSNLDSSDMQPHHWVELAQAVHEALDARGAGGAARYDGVVVAHGTDTMAYTASALAFLLPGIDRPVILTGAQRPIAEVRTDARANVVDAFHLATLPIPEVGVAFSARLLRGCRTIKRDAWAMDAFDAPGCAPLASLGVTVEVGAHVLPPSPLAPFDPRIEPAVIAVRAFPGLQPRLIHGALRAGVKGVVLEAFGSGNVPHLENSLVPVIEDARRRDIPVVIVSQCQRGDVDLRRYAGGRAALDAGAIGAGTMTAEAALAKLMVTLGRAADHPVETARRAFREEPRGEGRGIEGG